MKIHTRQKLGALKIVSASGVGIEAQLGGDRDDMSPSGTFSKRWQIFLFARFFHNNIYKITKLKF